jgi:hypothetical protein
MFIKLTEQHTKDKTREVLVNVNQIVMLTPYNGGTLVHTLLADKAKIEVKQTYEQILNPPMPDPTALPERVTLDEIFEEVENNLIANPPGGKPQ